MNVYEKSKKYGKYLVPAGIIASGVAANYLLNSKNEKSVIESNIEFADTDTDTDKKTGNWDFLYEGMDDTQFGEGIVQDAWKNTKENVKKYGEYLVPIALTGLAGYELYNTYANRDSIPAYKLYNKLSGSGMDSIAKKHNIRGGGVSNFGENRLNKHSGFEPKIVEPKIVEPKIVEVREKSSRDWIKPAAGITSAIILAALGYYGKNKYDTYERGVSSDRIDSGDTRLKIDESKSLMYAYDNPFFKSDNDNDNYDLDSLVNTVDNDNYYYEDEDNDYEDEDDSEDEYMQDWVDYGLKKLSGKGLSGFEQQLNKRSGLTPTKKQEVEIKKKKSGWLNPTVVTSTAILAALGYYTSKQLDNDNILDSAEPLYDNHNPDDPFEQLKPSNLFQY